MKKLDFWKICMRSIEFDFFLTIKYFLEEEEVEINEVFIEKIIQLLTGLNEGFNQYFPNDQQLKFKNELWIKNPFIVITRPSDMSISLISLKLKFKNSVCLLFKIFFELNTV